MDERLHHRGLVHVGADEHDLLPPVRLTVGPTDGRRARHGVNPVAGFLDHRQHGRPEALRRLSFQELRAHRLGDFGAGGLRHVEDVLDAKAAEHIAALDRLALCRRFAGGQPAGIAVRINGDLPVVSAGCEHRVAVLALVDRSAERSPGVEPGDVGRLGRTDSSLAVRAGVLGGDQHDVVRAVGVQPGLEGQVPLPVLSGLESCHLGRQGLLGVCHLRGSPFGPLLLGEPLRGCHSASFRSGRDDRSYLGARGVQAIESRCYSLMLNAVRLRRGLSGY